MTSAPQSNLEATCSFSDAAWDSYLSSQSIRADEAHNDYD